jgi:thioredoxin-dependent peroxiredoxin
MTAQLQRGDAAPKFTLPTADGDEVSLDDLRGRKVILYFYPAAMTTGCTAEARRMSQRNWWSFGSAMH